MLNFLNLIKKNKKIAIFSTTNIAEELFNVIKQERDDIEILYFIDSFKIGLFNNIQILSAEEASRKNDIDLVIIASFSNATKLEKILTTHGIKNYLKISKSAFEDLQNFIYRKNNKNSPEYFESGHYYSAVPSADDLDKYYNSLDFDVIDMDNINLNIDKQVENLEYFNKIYNETEFPKEKQENKFYFYNNVWFYQYDAYVLASMMRKYKPKNIIEIGSGFSTGVMLDINQKYFNNSINLSCIEPNPERLQSVLKEKYNEINIYSKKVQDVDVSIFKNLEENDILFIDSSHVAKINSDLIHIFFKILPSLNKNVIIHFHDIFNNFAYPKRWVAQKRCWNEVFFLKAFLQYNDSFKIEFYSDFMRAYCKKENIKTLLPIENGSGSLYIRKLV